MTIPRHARIVVLALLLAAAAWRSAATLIAQVPAVPLPALDVVAPLAIAAAVLFNARLDALRLKEDTETDWIVGAITIAAGVMILTLTRHRFGGAVWLWRPDLAGIALCALGVWALAAGTRTALALAPTVVLAAATTAPVIQLLGAGLNPSLPRSTVVGAGLAALPLLPLPPRRWRAFGLRVAAAVIAAVIAIAAAKAGNLSTRTGGILAAGITLALITALLWRDWADANARPKPLHIGLGRAAIVLALAAGLAAADALLAPTDSGALGQPQPGLSAPVGTGKTISTAVGLTVRSWRLPDTAENRSALAMTITGSSRMIVRTYPISTFLHWNASACPHTTTSHIDGVAVHASLYEDDVNGYRWNEYQWGTRVADGYQQSTIVVGTSPSGQPAPLPTVSANLPRAALKLLGNLVANRRLRCQATPVAGLADAERSRIEQFVGRSVGAIKEAGS